MWSRVIWGRTGVVILECRITVCNYLVEQNTRLVCVYSVVTRFYPELIRIFPISDLTCLCSDIQTRCFVSPHQHPLEVSAGGSKSLSTRKNLFEGQSMVLWHGPSIQQYHTRSNFVQHYIYIAIKLWHFPHVIHSEFATEDEKQWFIISTYMMTYLMMTNNKGRIRGRKIKPTRNLLTLCALCYFLALWRKRYLVGNLPSHKWLDLDWSRDLEIGLDSPKSLVKGKSK